MLVNYIQRVVSTGDLAGLSTAVQEAPSDVIQQLCCSLYGEQSAIEITHCILQIVSVYSLSWFLRHMTGFHFKVDTVCVSVCVRTRACLHIHTHTVNVNVNMSYHTRGSYDSITLAAFCTRLL
jgi:hypothetical protein